MGLTHEGRTIKQELEYVKPIPEFLETIIKKQGIKTGSCVFGGLQESSDVDILFLLDKKDDRLEMLNDFYFNSRIDTEFMRYVAGQYRDDDSEFYSVYIRCRFTKRPVNLLLFHDPRKYQIWVDATQFVSHAVKDAKMKQTLKDKRNRVHFFESVKHIFRR